MAGVYVGLGGNGLRAPQDLRLAAQRLRRLSGVRLVGVSPLYVSAPLGCPGRQRLYCNAVVQLQTVLPPGRVFRLLQAVERRIQRRRRRRNAPRRIDIDYLLHGVARLRRPQLTLPHPRMCVRGFVLLPLADLAGAQFAGLRGAAAFIGGLRYCEGQSVQRLS